uniref:S-acyl fatty acid synthase thioesterase, medium chain n=1 Tax=Anas platyrhynchos TaxID=8839 RepID=SAST_ANAPL|nr:RecName: Full=S-acyl fatty acid synthase thioesterase, medium chain; AltName: Full=Thioesterase II [Anas platyrhynchos]AAA49222.1 S-acyl fatty acid synthase thioesterase [Anas platyrhynchos]
MDKVIARPYKRPNALCRLICFPWAGGNCSFFIRWCEAFSSIIVVSVIRLAGRECRDTEPFPEDMAEVVNEITNALLKDLQEKPFALFGHSFGSFVSYALAVHLKEKHGLEPVHMFFSGSYGPHSEYFHLMYKLPEVEDSRLLELIHTLGGTPPEFLQNEQITKHLLRVLKEDQKVLVTYPWHDVRKKYFSCDLTCFNGSDEKNHGSEAWIAITSGDTSIYSLPGNHFYLMEPSNETFLIKYITKCIENSDI